MAALQIGKQQFQELLAQDKPLLVDYWAPWCGYCRRIGPAYDQIARQYQDQVQAVKINIDDEAALAQEARIDVIPTLVLYRDGKALASLTAPGSKAAIEDFLREALDQ